MKLLRIPLDCFVEICYKNEEFNEVFSNNTKKLIKKISKAEDIASAKKDLLKNLIAPHISGSGQNQNMSLCLLNGHQ